MIDLILAILAVWFVALFAGPAIYAAMGLAGFAFLFLAGIPGIVIPQKVAMAVNSFPLLAAPLFILMGNLMNSSGITHRIFDFAKAVVGWMRGGLCHANIVGSVIFAGMSGSAVADAAGLGTVEIEAMKKEGYDGETAAAITAASATIGPIIPPSLPMIVYGVAAETSIGGLFLAGVVPGLLMAAALMLMVRHLAIRQNLPRHPFEGARALWVAFRRAFWALMAPVVLFGGLFSGIFTPTEAAAVAVTYALVLGLFVYRDFRLADLPRIIVDTVETTGVVTALVMTASLLGYCISVSRLPQEFGAVLTVVDHESARLPADRQRAAARRRLLHGGAGRHAGPDSDSRATGDRARHRPAAVRPGFRAQPDDRHDHAAGGRGPLRDCESRRRALRKSREGRVAVSRAAIRGACDDHAVAASHDVAAEAAAGALRVDVRDNRRPVAAAAGKPSPHVWRGPDPMGRSDHAAELAARLQARIDRIDAN